ncbi:MAG: hypothetical protein ACLQE9_08835 [Roseiarcus sp.]
MSDAGELAGQISLLGGIVRGRIARALELESSDQLREILIDAQEGLDTLLELAAATAGEEPVDDA